MHWNIVEEGLENEIVHVTIYKDFGLSFTILQFINFLKAVKNKSY